MNITGCGLETKKKKKEQRQLLGTFWYQPQGTPGKIREERVGIILLGVMTPDLLQPSEDSLPTLKA